MKKLGRFPAKAQWAPRILLAAVVCAFCLRSAWADGIYKQEKAYKKMPEMPGQRALLIYRNGVERLEIESSVDGEGQRFGWIVPVPSLPTEIEKASPGLLRTLSLNVQPEIVHREWENAWSEKGWIAAAAMVLLWALIVISAGTMPRWAAMLLLLFLVLLASTLVSAGAIFRASSDQLGRETPGVKVERNEVVGNYEVSLLKAEAAEALNQWLDQNGFASFSAEGDTIVADYIRQGWHFVAAKLRREGGEALDPHPLGLTFKAQKPVYPMRLTALSGSSVALELFVVSERGASRLGPRTDHRIPGSAPDQRGLCESLQVPGGHRTPESQGGDVVRFLADEALRRP